MNDGAQDVRKGGAEPPPPRVLIIADNASAQFGGEAILPLTYFRLLARRGRDVRMITHSRNRDELMQTMPQLIERIAFSPDTRLHRGLSNLAQHAPGAIRDHFFGNLMGLLTGWHLRRIARELVRQGLVDVAHQPIPVSPAAPSLIHGLGVPVVIGPMNGAMRYPPGYEDYEGRASRVFITLGRPLVGLVNWLIPGKRRAARLLVANARTRAALAVPHPHVDQMSENGVDLTLWQATRTRRQQPGSLRLAFIGRLIALKALDRAIAAIANIAASSPALDITLDVMGDGPERAALEAQVNAAGLTGRVRFHGFVNQQGCVPILAACDCLILPSLRDCGGAVVLEAMAMGLPVIASDWGGPADYLNSQCGILVAPAPRDGFTDRLAQAIAALANDPQRAARMGAAGAERVRTQFDWQRKIDAIERIYAEIATRSK